MRVFSFKNVFCTISILIRGMASKQLDSHQVGCHFCHANTITVYVTLVMTSMVQSHKQIHVPVWNLTIVNFTTITLTKA